MKDSCNENYQTLLTDIEEEKSGTIFHVYGLEELILSIFHNAQSNLQI